LIVQSLIFVGINIANMQQVIGKAIESCLLVGCVQSKQAIRIFNSILACTLQVISAFTVVAIIGTHTAEAGPHKAPNRLFGLAVSINDPPNAIALAGLVGANSIRIDAPWAQIERNLGVYKIPEWLDRVVNSSISSGLQPLLILDYGNAHYDAGDKPTSSVALAAFAKYATFVAAHFKGKVFYYDLWNEWDAHTGKTTPMGAKEYVALARATYPAIKAIDPGIQVLSGGISDKGIREGFFQQFFLLDGARFVDGLSIHPYVWTGRSGRTPEGAMDLVDYVAALGKTSNGGQSLPMYITELGWPTHTGRYGVSEEEAAWFLTRFMLLAASREYIRGIYWYCLMDQGMNPDNKEHRFGVLDRNQKSRPAAAAFKAASELLSGDTVVTVTKTGDRTAAKLTRANMDLGEFHWQEGLDARNPSAPVTDDPRAPRWQSAIAR
jgi:polysaccharide biosynthesis protein PslG